MTRGIFLTAFRKRGYIFAAYNFAFSIKHFNPELLITIFHDDSINLLTKDQRKVFDNEIKIPNEIIGLQAAAIKISALNYLPYDETLLLDVDALALKDLTPIFDQLKEQGGYYYAKIVGDHKHHSKIEGVDLTKWRIIPSMIWAYADDIWNKYGLNEDSVLPATNSSFQYIRKCNEATELINQIKENYANPIPEAELRTPWGGGQPDELYLNIALAQKNINAKTNHDYIFLGNSLDRRTLSQLQKDYFILSLFGHRTMTRPRYKEWYDDLLIKYHRAKGLNHNYKSHLIMVDKHANTRAPQNDSGKVRPQNQPILATQPNGRKLKILIKFPTRSRPEKFLQCLSKAIELSNDKENLKILISYDEDDETMTEEVIEKAKALGNVELFSGKSENKIHAVNRDMEHSGEWDILVLLSDDMECEMKGWDDIIRSKFTGLDRILHFNDGYRKQSLLTLPIMGRSYYERFGYIYHPDYISLWADNEQMEVGQKLLRLKYFRIVLFRHKMAMNGFEQDELHKHTESFFEEDKKTYEARKRKGFPTQSILQHA